MRTSLITKLIGFTSEKSDEIVLAAIYALGEGAGNSSSAIDRLTELSESSSHDIRVAAIKALGRAHIRRYKS
ncbi:HEAT repeat domain-containing protein [Pantoea agglomerans]|jgi:HEAT repeat protein|uniref:HEAT repeat domain-containing protein n=1 Tax=Enterobacter agglomerans TaxID=549 RepID=UPI0017803BF5|nr:HEAT repeat domain-containing protein [Pantoea agglomerans]WVJ47878.1 HEAT repeat domain-containing protein [Pantoea agglomerans]